MVRAEGFTIRHRQIRTSLPVAALFINLSPPPVKAAHPARVEEAEEDNDDAKSEAGVESSTERHGILAPPGVGATLDEIVEDVADKGPDGEVKSRGGRDPRHGAKDDGQIHLADDAVLAAAGIQPQRDGQQRAKREAPHEEAVNGVRSEELARANHSPKDGSIEVHARNGAREAVERLSGAYALDVGEHPVEDAYLSDG